MIRVFYVFSILVCSPHTVVSHDSDYDAITTTPSGSYERIKSRAQEALYHGTYPRDIDFIKLKKRHMYYGTKLFEDRWTPGFEVLNSSEFLEQEGNSPRSPAQVVRDKEKFLAENPDYKNEKLLCYEELMRDKNVFLDDYDVVKYRKLVRDENLRVTVDWNRFRKHTNTTIPPEDPLSNELHRIHEEMFRTRDPLTQLEDLIRRKAEHYREQKRRENLTRNHEGKAVSYRYVRRPKPNCNYLYGKADIIDSGEYIKQLIDRRPRDPENSEDPDFIKYCLNRGYSFGFHEATTFLPRRNFSLPYFNLNRRRVLELMKSSEIDLEDNPEEHLDHSIDEDAIRAQYSNEVDALKKMKSLEAKRVEKLVKHVKKLKSKLKSTTTEKSVWMDHPLFLNRMFDHKAIVDRCMGENYTMVPTTIDFHMLYEMHRNTRTTDVSLLSREILRGQDTLQASRFEKYLHFMRRERNNSGLCGQDILEEELRARDPNVFQFVHNNVQYNVNDSREVMDIMRDYEENQARERSSSEMNHTTELSIWDHWETPGSTTEDPDKLKMEVLYKEPGSYNYGSHPWHNTSDEVELLWKKHKKEASPDYTYDETAFPMVTRTTPRSTTHLPAPWQVFRAKLSTIDRLDRRISDATTPEYEEQNARVLEYAAPGSQMARVVEIGFQSNESGPNTDFDERALVDEHRYDEAKKAHYAEASNVVHLDASHGASYMDLDPEEAIAVPAHPRRPSAPALKWRAITRRTQPTTPEPARTKAAWFVKSSQRYHQRLAERKRWEIEKLHRTKKPNISTHLPVGMLHEDDLYYDEAAMPVFDVLKARQRLEGTTSSYEVGTFENLPYVEKKNVMRASIKRQRALNEYWSRKFSVTTLHPPTRRTFNFHKVSSARYYWGAMHHTFIIHAMNSSEAYEDDKEQFYNKLGLNKLGQSKKSKTAAPAVTTQSGREKKTKTKKTKAPTTTGVTKSTTSFPIPLNGSYEEWHRWNQDVKEENNIISWYSDTSERIWAYKKNRSLYTRRPIEKSGVYYESGSRDYPVNCSLSLETDVPEPAQQWKQFDRWQKDRFTRLDLTFESIEEPPYEKLPIDMRTTLDSRAHQITLYPRATSPRILKDSSEEWEKLDRAIPRRTKPPRNATGRGRRSVGRERSQFAPSIVGEPQIEALKIPTETAIAPSIPGEPQLEALKILTETAAIAPSIVGEPQTRETRNATRQELRFVGLEKSENVISPSIFGKPQIEALKTLTFRKLYSGGLTLLTVGESSEVPFRRQYSGGASEFRDGMMTAVQNGEEKMVGCNLGQTTGGGSFRRAYSGGRIAADEDVQITDVTEAPMKSSTDSSNNETKKPIQGVNRSAVGPTRLNLKRLVNYLEKLKQKNSPTVEMDSKKEQMVVDNLKQLFAFLESEHVKLNGTNNLDRNREEQSNGQAELDKMRYSMRSAAHKASRIEFKNNIMDMPAMQELKNQSSSNNNVDISERSLIKKLTMKNMKNNASRIEFKNNIMEMPAIKELKNQLSSKINVSNNNVDSSEWKLIKNLTMKNIINKDLVHTLKILFQHISERKMNKTKNIDEKQDQYVEESSNYLPKHELSHSLSNGSKDFYEVQTTISTVSNPSNKESYTATKRVTTSIDGLKSKRIDGLDEEIHYDENSKEIYNQFLPDIVHLNYSSDDYFKKKPTSKLTLKGLVLKLYKYLIDIISAISFFIDSAVKTIHSIKVDVSKECAALKNETIQLVNSIYFYLKLEEGVINLFRYAKLQEKNSAIPRLHRLKKCLFSGSHKCVSDSKELYDTYPDILKFKRFRRSPILNQLEKKLIETSKIRMWNDIENKFKTENTNEKSMAFEIEHDTGPVNTHNEKYPFLSRLFNDQRKTMQRYNKVAEKSHNYWWQIRHFNWFRKLCSFFANTKGIHEDKHEDEHKIEPNTRHVSPTISKSLRSVLLDVYKLGPSQLHRKRKRDVVYTYSDESTVDPDDQWYIDLAAREFVQGRDKNDPNYNRSKFIKNLKRSGIFSFGNFSQECLSNKTYPTDKPPTTWSRNFSIRYQPCTFWNWSRYLQVHSSYMDYLFGTGTPLTTRKRKRNLTAKRMRAHQDFLNRFSPKTTLRWPSSIWFNTTDWSEMESYADKVLKIKGNTDREPDDYFTMNSELRRISSIVWEQPEITEATVRKRKKKPRQHEGNSTGGVKTKPDRPEDELSEETRVHRKRKKKPNGSGENRSLTEESEVYYDEMERHSTTEHIPDWEYADRMFRHWKRIKD